MDKNRLITTVSQRRAQTYPLLELLFVLIKRTEAIASILHAMEGFSEREVFKAYGIKEGDLLAVLEETGIPAAWHPMIKGCDRLPELPNGLPTIPQALVDHLKAHERVSPTPKALERIRDELRAFYIAGPGASLEEVRESSDDNRQASAFGEDAIAVGAFIPIPHETFIEELSLKVGIHPISVYWLLEEMRHAEGLVCPAELQRLTEDYLSVKLLQILGHCWPMQDQYEEEEGRPFIHPKWIDEDGIIPITPGSGEEILIDRFRRFLDEEFGPERGPEVEKEAGMILGWKKGDEWGRQKPTTLERWFEKKFFKRHVSEFRKRPIAWHLTSKKGAFQVIVYYHKFNTDRLRLLRARYIRQALDNLRRQLAEIQAVGEDRRTLAQAEELEAKIADVEDFDRRLGHLLEGREREARIWCPWKEPDKQPVGWDPDINDGVRVNIAPVQRLGLLAASVLTSKDLKSLLAPEGRE